MKKILTYFKPYMWQSVFGSLLKLLEATFELLVPFIVALIVDDEFGRKIRLKKTKEGYVETPFDENVEDVEFDFDENEV